MIPFVDKNNFSIYRYAKTTGRSVVPWFFLETPEIYSSFKLLPNSMHRANILTHRKDKRAGDFFETLSIMNESKDKLYKRKCETYTMNGFPVIPQIQKFTGFEKLKDVFDEKYKHLVTIQDKLAKITTQSSTRTFDLLYRNKYEAMFQHDKYEVYEK
jgi:hypothetical protein